MMKFYQFQNRLKIFFLILLFFAAPLLSAELFQFETIEQENRYHTIIKELRCLVCQNQTIADSNAPLANDLRKKVFDEIKQGKSEPEIINLISARYGEFVVYRPLFSLKNLLLWCGPFVFLAAGVFYCIRFFRTRQK